MTWKSVGSTIFKEADGVLKAIGAFQNTEDAELAVMSVNEYYKSKAVENMSKNENTGNP